MKENELRKAATCGICHKKIGHTGLPLFWQITIERFGIDLRSIQRQDGLAAILGSSRLASVMGPGEEMTIPLLEPVKVSICDKCIMEPVIIAVLVEMASSHEEDG